jgi:IclR family acetate operon transcriptional repressor
MQSSAEQKGPSLMKNVHTSLRAFETVAAHQPLGLKQIVDRLGVPTTTAHRALATLLDAGWIAATGDGTKRYVVSGRLSALISGVAQRLLSVGGPVCRELRDRCGESVALSIPDGSDHMVILGHWEGRGVLRVVEAEGTRAPIVAAATGKAYLAFCPPGVRARILNDAPRALTVTRVDAAELDHEIEMAAARGWAIVNAEWLEGVAQIGSVIVVNGEPVGGVGIGLPAHRLDADLVTDLGSQVKAAADEIAALMSPHVAPVR